MSRFRRFENLEKRRPTGSAAPARHSSVTDRFGAADTPTPPAADPPVARSQGSPGRFEDEPARSPALRVLELDDGQPFVRCARCRADGYVTATACSHCGADLTTQEQRAYNEAYWRRRQAEEAERQEELAKLKAAREQAERELAEATRELRRRSASGRTLDDGDDLRDPLRAAARALGRRVGTWLRRAFPNRTHRVTFAALVALALVALVATFPIQAWGVLWALLILTAIWGWFRRMLRVWRE